VGVQISIGVRVNVVRLGVRAREANPGPMAKVAHKANVDRKTSANARGPKTQQRR
jgi:hypothetical protein